jgi:hypothetical protein
VLGSLLVALWWGRQRVSAAAGRRIGMALPAPRRWQKMIRIRARGIKSWLEFEFPARAGLPDPQSGTIWGISRIVP